MRIVRIAIGLAAACLVASCGFFKVVDGNGEVQAQSRDVASGGFDKIDVSGIGEVELRVSDACGITVVADSNLLEHIETRTAFGTLYISIEPGISIGRFEELRYEVSAPSLSGIRSSGVADISCLGSFEGPRIDIDLSGVGSLDFQGDYSVARLVVSGAGSIELAGSGSSLFVESSGVGTVKAGSYAVLDASADVSGVGSVTLRASRSLKASLSGMGNLYYYENPVKDLSITGFGSVQRLYF